jgi:general stress protein 26
MPEHPSETELLTRLRKAIAGTRAVMVGVAGEGVRHFNPMKAHVAEGERPIWFLCRRDAALVQDLGGHNRAGLITVVSDDHHLHASVAGELSAERDQARIDQFWTSVADAWLPEGRLSNEVILLRFDPAEAEVWLSDNSFKLAWEVAKANFNREPIESGARASLRM